MQPRLNVVTLAVQDLPRSLGFYRDGLGLQSKGIIGTAWRDPRSGANGAVAFFELKGGLILALYPHADLVKDSDTKDGTRGPAEFSLGYLVKTREEVDAIVRQAKAAGAKVTEEPRERPWGIYSGYFADLDGHLWEIVWNPAMRVAD